jgi:hypothetical protein
MDTKFASVQATRVVPLHETLENTLSGAKTPVRRVQRADLQVEPNLRTPHGSPTAPHAIVASRVQLRQSRLTAAGVEADEQLDFRWCEE